VNARGAGGFSRRFALKQCHPHLIDEAEFVARFLDEGRLAARIHHPNVVSTIDIVHEGSELYLVMEYVDGISVASLTKRALAGEALPRAAIVRIAIDALAGLEAAHTLADDAGVPLHVTHRDVSPQNILVGRDGIARITDFGIARARDSSVHSREGEVRGKFSYMAPEQLVGTRAVDARADVFATAVVVWELLAGRSFRSASSQEAIASIVSGERAEAPSAHAPDISPDLDAVVLRALARDPADRPSTAREFASLLEKALAPSNAQGVAELVVSSTPVASAPAADATEPMEREVSAPVASRPRVTAPITLEVEEPKREKRSRALPIAAVAVTLALATGAAFAWPRAKPPAPTVTASPTPSPTPSPTLQTPTPTLTQTQTQTPTPVETASVKPPRPTATHKPITRPSATATAWRPSGP
jgi:serine/threonine-protein kinase